MVGLAPHVDVRTFLEVDRFACAKIFSAALVRVWTCGCTNHRASCECTFTPNIHGTVRYVHARRVGSTIRLHQFCTNQMQVLEHSNCSLILQSRCGKRMLVDINTWTLHRSTLLLRFRGHLPGQIDRLGPVALGTAFLYLGFQPPHLRPSSHPTLLTVAGTLKLNLLYVMTLGTLRSAVTKKTSMK